MSARSRAHKDALSGRHVTAILLAIIVATAVVPPAAAWKLNQSRVERATERAHVIAQYLRLHRDELEQVARRADVVCGFGLVPKALGANDPWLQSPVALPDVFGPARPTDPWGQCYLLNVAALRNDGPVLVLSTGPNGFVDTPIDASTLRGDDVGERVW